MIDFICDFMYFLGVSSLILVGVIGINMITDKGKTDIYGVDSDGKVVPNTDKGNDDAK